MIKNSNIFTNKSAQKPLKWAAAPAPKPTHAPEKASIFKQILNTQSAKFAMKPHFLLSCAAFALSALLYEGASDFLSLHIFWFLDIAMGAAYCGFLFTAMPAWQGFGGSLKAHNCILFGLLFLAICSLAFSLQLAAALALAFWLILLLCVLFIGFSTRKASFLQLILAALVGAKIAYFLSADLAFAHMQIMLNAAAVNFISFKISAAITRSALDEAGLFKVIFIPNAAARNLSVFGCLLAAASVFCSEQTQSFICLAAGCFMLARLRDFVSITLLKSLYIAGFAALLALIGAGFFAAAFLGTSGLHVLAIFSVCGMIFAVFCIAGRRHFGQALRFNIASLISALCIIAAAFVRGFELGGYYLELSIWLLAAAFAIEFIQLFNIMRKNRFIADG